MPVNSIQTVIVNNSIVTLNWPTYVTNPPFLSDINLVDVTGAGTNQVVLPNATQGLSGFTCQFSNTGSHNFTILLNDGVTDLLTGITPGQNYQLILTETDTINGTWLTAAYIGSDDPIVSVTAISPDVSINITNPTVTPPSGTIDFQLQPSLKNLQDVATTGYVAITANDPSTWTTRTFTSDSNIVITNPDGVAGQSNFALSDTINVSQFFGGQIHINGSTIQPQAANTNLNILTNGIGHLNLNGSLIDTEANLTVNDLTLTGKFLSPFASFISFIDTGTAIIVGTNVGFSMPVKYLEGTQGRYNIPFDSIRANTNYTVIISAASQANIDQPPIILGFLIAGSETTSGFDIVVTDQNGELAPSIPNGITILLLSAT